MRGAFETDELRRRRFNFGGAEERSGRALVHDDAAAGVLLRLGGGGHVGDLQQRVGASVGASVVCKLY